MILTALLRHLASPARIVVAWALVVNLWGIAGAPKWAAAAESQQQPPGKTPEGSQDVSQISVALDTLTMLNGEKGDIEVLQLLRVINAGDQPFIGEQPQGGQQSSGMRRPVFRIPLPEGAFDIAPSDLRNPQAMTEGPSGIYTTAPLPPGETLISLVYRVRPPRTGWGLSREIDYPTRSINLLVGPGLELESAPGFKLTERKTLGKVQYRRFRAGPFSPGSVLTADVGFGEAQSPSQLWARFASAAVVVLAVGLGLALFLRRRRRNPDAAGMQDRQTFRPESSREDLILRIALLDEQFESGSISESAYASKRAEMKKRLLSLSETVNQ